MDAVSALGEAMGVRDEDAARALCTERGFAAAGDSVGRLYAQGARKGFRVQPLAAVEGREGRVVVTALLGSKGSSRGAGQVWLLGHDDGERCRLEGVARNSALVALFLDGELPALFDGRALPPAPAAEAWGGSLAKALREAPGSVVGHVDPTSPAGAQAAEAMSAFTHDTVGPIRVLGSGAVAALDRQTVGLIAGASDGQGERQLWLVIEGTPAEGSARVVGAGESPTADRVLGAGADGRLR